MFTLLIRLHSFNYINTPTHAQLTVLPKKLATLVQGMTPQNRHETLSKLQLSI